HPERWLLPELAPHPAHLHINLLAEHRGAGHGRELISTFLASVAAAGAASCYLGVRPENLNARRFYAKLGWRPVEVCRAEPGPYLVPPPGYHAHPPVPTPGPWQWRVRHVGRLRH